MNMKLFRNTSSALIAAITSLALFAATASAIAAETLSFKGKTITILVGSTAGGSTDFFARLLGPFLTKYLPGNPNVIVQNKPGAHGLTATNYFAQQAAPDGLTAIVGSTAQIDPINYRVPQSHYDPSQFSMIGGIDLGGTVMIIHNKALARLTDKKAEPVTMGSIAGFPHTGMLMTAWGIEYLGWNARWVEGYRGVPDLMLALQRGEFDMTSVVSTFLNPTLLNKDKFTILYQTGTNGGTTPSDLPSIAKVPMFSAAMKGKISDPVGQQAFDYWRNISSTKKWAALPPKTPEPIVSAYRAAFHKIMTDPDFLARGKKLSEDFSTDSPEDLMATVATLDKVSNEALGFMTKTLHKEGLDVVNMAKGKHETKSKK